MAGHFHPKGKAPSKFTLEVLEASAQRPAVRRHRGTSTSRRRGLSRPCKTSRSWPTRGTSPGTWSGSSSWTSRMTSTASIPRCCASRKLNNNYGLYEVIPGIYQVRGFDLSDISFVRGKTGWIVFDPLVTTEPVRAAWKLFQQHVGQGPSRLGRDLFPHAWRPLGRRARHRRRSGCEVGQGPDHRARRLHGLHGLRKRLCRQCHEPAAVLSVRPAAARQSAWLCRSGTRPRLSRPARRG